MDTVCALQTIAVSAVRLFVIALKSGVDRLVETALNGTLYFISESIFKVRQNLALVKK